MRHSRGWAGELGVFHLLVYQWEFRVQLEPSGLGRDPEPPIARCCGRPTSVGLPIREGVGLWLASASLCSTSDGSFSANQLLCLSQVFCDAHFLHPVPLPLKSKEAPEDLPGQLFHLDAKWDGSSTDPCRVRADHPEGGIGWALCHQRAQSHRGQLFTRGRAWEWISSYGTH